MICEKTKDNVDIIAYYCKKLCEENVLDLIIMYIYKVHENNFNESGLKQISHVRPTLFIQTYFYHLMEEVYTVVMEEKHV